MRCPRTGTELKPLRIGGVEVDVSEHCAGVWFDRFELDKFKSPNDAMGAALAAHLAQFDSPLLDLSARLRCPRHPESVMMRRFFGPARKVEIDECPECGGIWLDAEELHQIRQILAGHGAGTIDYARVDDSIAVIDDSVLRDLDHLANALGAA